MKKNVKDDKVLRAITIGITAMIAATSMPLNVLADEFADGNANGAGDDTNKSTEDAGVTQVEAIQNSAEDKIDDISEAQEDITDVTEQMESIGDIINETITTEDGEVVNKTEVEQNADNEIVEAATSVIVSDNNANNSTDTAISKMQDVVEALGTADDEKSNIESSCEQIENITNQATDIAEDLNTITDNINDTIDEADTAISESATVAEAQEAFDEATDNVQKSKEKFDKKLDEFKQIEEEYDNASKEYDDALKRYDEAIDKARSGSASANEELAAAKEALSNAEDYLKQLEGSLDSAKNAAQKAKENAVSEQKLGEKELNMNKSQEQLSDAETSYENAKEKAIEAAVELEVAKNNYSSAKVYEMKNKTLSNWNEKDKLFKEIVEGYYVSKVLVPGATNVRLIPSSEINDGKAKGPYFIKFDDTTRNYVKVAYELNGETNYVYLNYKSEPGKQDTYVIFEKVESVDEKGKTIYTNGNYDDYVNGVIDGSKMLFESENDDYIAWYQKYALEAKEKSTKTISNSTIVNNAKKELEAAEKTKIASDEDEVLKGTEFEKASNKYNEDKSIYDTAYSEVARINSEFDLKDDEYKQINTKYESAKQSLTEAQDKVATITTAINKLEIQIESLTASKSSELITAKARLAALDAQLKKAQDDKNAAKQAYEELEDKLNNLKTTLENKKEEIANKQRIDDKTRIPAVSDDDNEVVVISDDGSEKIAGDTIQLGEPVLDDGVNPSIQDNNIVVSSADSRTRMASEAISSETISSVADTPSVVADEIVQSTVAGVRLDENKPPIETENIVRIEETEDIDSGVAGVRRNIEEDAALDVNKTVVSSGEMVTIEDGKVPLAMAPQLTKDVEKMNWWWMIIVAILGTTGLKMYQKSLKKKAVAAEKSDDSEQHN